MGMDVESRKPDDECFSASIWSWRALNQLLLDSGAVDSTLHQDMSYNGGMGPKTPEECDFVVAKLQQWLDEHPGIEYSVLYFQGAPRVHKGHFVGAGDAGESIYTVRRDRIVQFVEFVKRCRDKGGFAVW